MDKYVRMVLMKRTLVLAGGGTKGIYQCGVIRALKELKEDEFDCIIGVSVGALNAALLVQNEFEKMEKMYDDITPDQIVNGFIPVGVTLSSLISERQSIQEQISYYMKEGGIDVRPFYKMVDDYYNEDKFFHSRTDFGCIAALKKDHSGVYVTKDMMKEHAKDWLISSASAYPAFPAHEIDGVEYVDGGYYDNFPIDEALKNGSEEVVGVELNDKPLHPFFDNKKMIRIIRPHAPLYSFLDFDSDKLKKAKILGYNDTMKSYGRYMGLRYTFLPFETDSFKDDVVRTLLMLETEIKNANRVNDRLFSESVITDRLKEAEHRDALNESDYFFGMMDAIMDLCGMDDSETYEFRDVLERIVREFEDASRADYKFMGNLRPTELLDFVKNLDHRTVVKLLIHNTFYPDHTLIPRKVIMTVYPFDVAEAEVISMMIRYVKEG